MELLTRRPPQHAPAPPDRDRHSRPRGRWQERTIAEQFRHWAEALEGRWFRTTALLRSLAGFSTQRSLRALAGPRPTTDGRLKVTSADCPYLLAFSICGPSSNPLL